MTDHREIAARMCSARAALIAGGELDVPFQATVDAFGASRTASAMATQALLEVTGRLAGPVPPTAEDWAEAEAHLRDSWQELRKWRR